MIRKSSFRPPSPGECIQEQPCRTSPKSTIWQATGPHAPTPSPRPSDVRRRRLCIWLLALRGLCVPWRAPILHNLGGQLCEAHHCAHIYRHWRVQGDSPRWHYLWPHAGKHHPHNRYLRQRRRRRHQSDSLQDRVQHQQKGAGKVARAIPRYRTGQPLRGKGRHVRNPYGRAASLLACLRTPAVGPQLRHLLYRLHTGFLRGSRQGDVCGPPLPFRRLSRARRPSIRHAHRRTHDIGEHR